MHYFILFLALLPGLLFSSSISNESEILSANHTPLTTLYGLPETNLYGVNVINGDYNYSCVDFDLPGSDPCVFQRTYCSSQNRLRAFFHGWSHNHTNGAKTYSLSNKLHVVLCGSLSGEIPFRTDLGKSDEVLTVNRDIFKKGVTNCGKGHISGRLNIKNMKVKYATRGIEITNADGTVHRLDRKISRRAPKPEYISTNYLTETIKPNGLRTLYKSDTVLRHVQSLTSDETISNEIEFQCPNLSELLGKRKLKEASFDINGASCDGKTAKYSFRCRKKRVQMSDDTENEGFIISMLGFDSTHLPSERYSYFDRHDGHEILSERSGPHHKMAIEYYQKGDRVPLYHYEDEDVTSNHVALDRVKQISVAVNDADDIRPLVQFCYRKNKVTKEAFTDAYQSNHLTRFHYSTKNYQLNCIERFTGTAQYALSRIERFHYGAESTALEGDLIYKTVASANETIHYGENYDYDERGNVLKKKCHYRTFTNSKFRPISIGNNRLQGGEVRATTYTYNELNLPISQNDGRLTTLLTYHSRNGKATNLPKSRLIQKNGKTARREFYAFDDNAGCTLKIEDDGSESSKADQKGITNRKITRFINRKGSFAGLPLEIDVWGSNGQEEQRISRTTLQYDAHGFVSEESIYDANNQLAYTIHKIRDKQGNIVSETNPLGQTTTRVYNEYGSLLEEQGPSLNKRMQYIYDWLQRPVMETCKGSDGIDLTTVKSYDMENRATEIKDPYGNQTHFIYNEQGLPIEIVHPPIRTEKGTWTRPVERKEYNFIGHMMAETDPDGAVTLYIRNDAGLPLKITYPDGTSERFYYSIYGDLLEKRLRNGSKTVYTYDDFSRLLTEKTYDQKGTLLKECGKTYTGSSLSRETDGEGLEKSYSYDYAGRISECSQGHTLTKYLYDSLGRLAEERRYYGEHEADYIATQLTYDLLNRVTKKKEVDAKGKTHTKIKTDYDLDGNVSSTTTWSHAGMATTTNTYDPRGHLKSSTDPLGNTTYYHHRYDFVFEGQNLPCLEVVDPTGVKTTTITDSYGSVIRTSTRSPFGDLLADTELFYDLKHNLIRKEQYLPNGTIVDCWEYDSTSKLIRQINGAGTSEQIITTFIYNSFGELAETHYADGTSKHRLYDGVGRLSEEWSNDQSIHYSYTYNQHDLPLSVRNCKTDRETVRTYSPEGNLLSETLENGLKMTYQYDRLNRLIESIYPDGTSVKQTYSPVFLTKAERVKNGSSYAASFKGFDQSGKPNTITFPKKSGKLKLTYDLLSRPIDLSYPHYQEKNISYDTRGLLTSKHVNGDPQTFDHDSLQQLTLEKTAHYSHSYENDALHRQTSVDGSPQTHNAVHQLTQGVNDSYQYDAKGRRTQDSITTYTYDPFDRLISAQQGDLSWHYTYDAFNRKMSRTFAGKTVQYLYNGHEEIGSFDHDRCLDLKILSGSEGSIPIAIELGDQTYAPMISSQGHIIGLTEIETGDLADLSFLTLFGKDLAEKPLSPWRFCGKRHEEASLGIIDFGFRFYHPKSAQWLTQDPLGESAGPNLYAYVYNNPARYIDRFGLFLDDFSFSGAWESFKDTCSSAWSDFTSTCSSAWDSIRDGCSQGSNYTRCNGGLRAIAGLSECALGIGLMSSGIGFFPGAVIFSLGFDNYLTGCNEGYCGQSCKPVTTQLLEKSGLPPAAASIANEALGFTGVGIAAYKFISSSIKTGTRLLSTIKQGIRGGAESPNAAANLSRKLSRLENFQQIANETKVLPDGRIRYYSAEKFSHTLGPTKGAHNVMEWNPKTGHVRGWYECLDHFGNVNRVHPKNINGQVISSPHYPKIGRELIK